MIATHNKKSAKSIPHMLMSNLREGSIVIIYLT